MSFSTNIRAVARIVTAHQQREGAGFLVRRPFPRQGFDQLNPFLMLDEVGPVTYAPGEAIGALDHPPRGIETVFYILSGEKLHEDSAGKTQLIGPGDVQWMTAGVGIVHSESPGADFKASGGLAHGFQVWVNLPARRKFAEPGYQYLKAGRIPKAGLIEVRVVAGEAFGTKSVIGTQTPIWLQDWQVAPGASAEVKIDSDFNVAAYVFEGTVCFGADKTVAEQGQLVVMGHGMNLQVHASPGNGTGRFLLLAGEPFNEPIARYGPFVMNTQESW